MGPRPYRVKLPMPRSFVIHRWCAIPDEATMVPIGRSRDGSLEHRARPETVDAFNRMKNVAAAAGVRLHVIWAFRSPKLQKEQFEEAEQKYGRGKGIRWLAPPGFSEHQTGWVLDIGDADDTQADDNPLFERTKAFRWLNEHAGDYGFELSFPKGNWQGVGYEPWHWRFVGTADAQAAFHPRGLRAVIIWIKSWTMALRCWCQARL
jgi:D-alanyl-D-alanine carboxypeptidase